VITPTGWSSAITSPTVSSISCPDLTTMPAGFINQEYKLRQENPFKFEQKSAINEVNSIG
jgi:hypothetical protein